MIQYAYQEYKLKNRTICFIRNHQLYIPDSKWAEVKKFIDLGKIENTKIKIFFDTIAEARSAVEEDNYFKTFKG
ncbi:MAG: hypothetical protein A4E71_02656 [Smithella sp. PtaU1.Bin162]|nr:MAG: hypothetical protein A4E71_02656 [Smithella sp. PtaU1.Bin162]